MPSLMKFEKNSRSLEQKKSMNSFRHSFGFIYLNNSLFSIGGIDLNNNIINKCEKYNLRLILLKTLII